MGSLMAARQCSRCCAIRSLASPLCCDVRVRPWEHRCQYFSDQRRLGLRRDQVKSKRHRLRISSLRFLGRHSPTVMTMEDLPGPYLEVIEPQVLFQLLMDLFANPSAFDRSS